MARVKYNNDKLTKQQEIFVNELVKGNTQRQASQILKMLIVYLNI